MTTSIPFFPEDTVTAGSLSPHNSSQPAGLNVSLYRDCVQVRGPEVILEKDALPVIYHRGPEVTVCWRERDALPVIYHRGLLEKDAPPVIYHRGSEVTLFAGERRTLYQ
ncbi:hypothetical protein ACOMHN_012381 [Nucella lapillus]